MPDPVLENDTFLDFEKIYGTSTDEVARPSAQKTPEKSEKGQKLQGNSGCKYVQLLIYSKF